MKLINVNHDESQLLGHRTRFSALTGFSTNSREYIIGLTFNMSWQNKRHKWIDFHLLFKTIRLRIHGKKEVMG